jgi:hypothetical protein
MRRKAPDIVHINLRLQERLRQRLAQEAERHGFSLTNEIRIRLEDSFEAGDKRGLESIRADMDISWGRFAARFLRLELEEKLATEIMRGESITQIRLLAKLWLDHRAEEQRQRGGVS